MFGFHERVIHCTHRDKIWSTVQLKTPSFPKNLPFGERVLNDARQEEFVRVRVDVSFPEWPKRVGESPESVDAFLRRSPKPFLLLCECSQCPLSLTLVG